MVMSYKDIIKIYIKLKQKIFKLSNETYIYKIFYYISINK